jgi:hypothetical protein
LNLDSPDNHVVAVVSEMACFRQIHRTIGGPQQGILIPCPTPPDPAGLLQSRPDQKE